MNSKSLETTSSRPFWKLNKCLFMLPHGSENIPDVNISAVHAWARTANQGLRVE
jgi:hypothetical protein